MSNTPIALGDHFQGFINQQVQSGRYQSASEVMQAGLRLLEIEEQKRQMLVQALIEGEENGIAEDFDRKIRIRPARRSLSGVLTKFAKFAPDFMADGRGDQEQAERNTL